MLRKAVRYWKTFLYHLLEIVATNSSILFNWRRMESQQKRLSQMQFLDRLVQQIIEKYRKRTPDTDDYTIMHGANSGLGKSASVLIATQAEHSTSAPTAPMSFPCANFQNRTATPFGTNKQPPEQESTGRETSPEDTPTNKLQTLQHPSEAGQQIALI